MNNIVFRAIKFAERKHKGQFRKMSGEPYIVHPLKVSYLLMKYKPQSKSIDNLLVASILHDTLEDTNTTFEEISKKFNPMIASIVYELTTIQEDKEKLGKAEYLKKRFIGYSSYALTIKLLDRLANIMDNPTQKTITDTINILNFVKENRKLSKTQISILDDILLECNLIK